MTGRKRYPTEEVDPENFLDNEKIIYYLENRDNFKFKQDDWIRLLNCVHCNECGTSNERALLNRKFLDDGNEIPGLNEMIENFRQFNSPFATNKMRIHVPDGIPRSSHRLFFMGCLSTIKIPKFTNHALDYLLKNDVDFTILEREVCCGYPLYVSGAFEEYERVKNENAMIFSAYEEVLCLCPACYFIFKTSDEFKELNVKFTFISDYLKPSPDKKAGSVSIQHLCQLKNRGRPDVASKVNNILQESGYEVLDIAHWCCGGGIGFMHRTDVITKIAEKRMLDFEGDYFTTYCPGCYWIMKRFRRKLKNHDKTKLIDTFALLL
ncbi:MAG: heterodisulfide reductase-related iron-sulfur binding cluster [Promethearchaeota archaeon]